jgi:hypothetical protein
LGNVYLVSETNVIIIADWKYLNPLLGINKYCCQSLCKNCTELHKINMDVWNICLFSVFFDDRRLLDSVMWLNMCYFTSSCLIPVLWVPSSNSTYHWHSAL